MEKDKNNKEVNHIKIGAQTRVRNVISYALLLLKERNFNDITLSAIGGAIGSLVNAVEVIKADLKLYQNNKISTVSYQTMDSNENIIQERLYPKMEVVLSKDEPKVKTEGYQPILGDDERKKIKDFMDARKEIREKYRSEGRRPRGRGYGGRGDFGREGGQGQRDFGGRGAPRGRGFGRGFGRGAPRGRGFGGDRGFSRGGRGFSGNRDFGGDRDFGGERGFRGAPRGGRGFSGRGAPRGGRGFTGRGAPRGGRGFTGRGGNSRRGSMDRSRGY
jgi:hypothetical protein